MQCTYKCTNETDRSRCLLHKSSPWKIFVFCELCISHFEKLLVSSSVFIYQGFTLVCFTECEELENLQVIHPNSFSFWFLMLRDVSLNYQYFQNDLNRLEGLVVISRKFLQKGFKGLKRFEMPKLAFLTQNTNYEIPKQYGATNVNRNRFMWWIWSSKFAKNRIWYTYIHFHAYYKITLWTQTIWSKDQRTKVRNWQKVCSEM